MKKNILSTKVLQLILGLSLIINLVLGFLIYHSNSMSAEEASGIKNFQYRVPCNTVFGYRVCTSDFVGLSDGDAAYKARIHGLNPVVNVRDGKVVRAYVLEDKEPFRINFKINNEVVTEAFFQ